MPLSIAKRFFLVDPLDGTKAFVRGEAHFTVNIGLIEDGIPVAGAVAAPATGEVWFTTAGGARKRVFGETGGQPVRVRPRNDADVLALTSHTLKPEQYEKLQAEYGITRRQPMDSSVKLCVIAEGGADIYPRHGATMEWDIAAGHAVLTAAGGSLTATDGTPFVYGKADEGFKNGWFVARGVRVSRRRLVVAFNLTTKDTKKEGRRADALREARSGLRLRTHPAPLVFFVSLVVKSKATALSGSRRPGVLGCGAG